MVMYNLPCQVENRGWATKISPLSVLHLPLLLH